MRNRQHIAEYLIEHASSLPYDCATELSIPTIPETSSSDSPPTSADECPTDDDAAVTGNVHESTEHEPRPPTIEMKQEGDDTNESLPSPIKAPHVKSVPSHHAAPSMPPPAEPLLEHQDDSPPEKFMLTLERPPSLVLAQKKEAHHQQMLSSEGSMQLEDLESAPSSPRSLVNQQKQQRSSSSPSAVLSTTASSLRSDDDDIVAIVTRAESFSQSSRQDTESALLSLLGPDYETAVGGDTAPRMAESRSQGRANSLFASSRHTSDSAARRNQSTPQLKIVVRTHGTVDSTTMRDTLEPQTLRSTEDLRNIVAKEVARLEESAAMARAVPVTSPNSSVPSKKTGFISDLKQILKRKKTSPPPLELPQAAATTRAETFLEKARTGDDDHGDRVTQRASPTRSFAAASTDTTLEKPSRRTGPPAPMHPSQSSRAKPEKGFDHRSVGTQTCPSSPAKAVVDKSTATIVRPEDLDESSQAFLLQTLEDKLQNMHTASRLVFCWNQNVFGFQAKVDLSVCFVLLPFLRRS